MSRNKRIADTIRLEDDQDDVPIVQFRNARYRSRGNTSTPKHILIVFSFKAKILFDTGATHSFVSLYFAIRFDKQPTLLKSSISVSTPLDELILVKYVYLDCEIEIRDKIFIGDLNVLDMVDFDVILGMDWLAKHRASVNCWGKKIILLAISRKMARKGVQCYLTYRMAPAELRELKEQLQDLFDKKFIRLSVSS